MPEHRLWTAMSREWTWRKKWRLEPGTPVGIPDVMWVGGEGKHRTGFLELKWDEKVVRPAQAIMLRNLWEEGGSAFVLAHWEGKKWLVPGWAITLETQILYENSVAQWDDAIDWGELERVVSSA